MKSVLTMFLCTATLVLAQQPVDTPDRSAGHADAPIVGKVTDKGGQPIVGVTVFGSRPNTCCPVPSQERVTTDQNGEFRIEHPGAVLHFSKDKLRPKTFVIGSEKSPVHIILEPSANNLIVSPCGKLGPHQARIGWGKRGLQFNVDKHLVNISGGKPDVDYVRYVVMPKTGKAYLELWFGPYALSTTPNDDQFINSEKFEQRDIVEADGSPSGLDSWGQQRDGKAWRRVAVLAQGATYKGASPEQARLFDQIMNSVCEAPQ